MVFNRQKYSTIGLLHLLFLLILIPSTAYSGDKNAILTRIPIVHNEKARITVVQNVVLPSVYKTFLNIISSEEKSGVAIGGKNGVNALLNVTGRSGGVYSLYFSDNTPICNTEKTLICGTVHIGVSSLKGSDGKQIGRLLDSNGNDAVELKAYVNFESMPRNETGVMGGTYDNSKTPLVVTASYE